MTRIGEMDINQSGKWMKISGFVKVFLVVLFLSQSVAAEELPEFQGYYVKNGNEYVLAEPYKHVRFGFDKLKSIVSVEREDDSLYVHVYRENWDPVRSYFYTRPIAIINHELYDELLPKVKSLGDDRYLLKFEDIGPDNVHQGFHRVIMLLHLAILRKNWSNYLKILLKTRGRFFPTLKRHWNPIRIMVSWRKCCQNGKRHARISWMTVPGKW